MCVNCILCVEVNSWMNGTKGWMDGDDEDHSDALDDDDPKD